MKKVSVNLYSGSCVVVYWGVGFVAEEELSFGF